MVFKLGLWETEEDKTQRDQRKLLSHVDRELTREADKRRKQEEQIAAFRKASFDGAFETSQRQQLALTEGRDRLQAVAEGQMFQARQAETNGNRSELADFANDHMNGIQNSLTGERDRLQIRSDRLSPTLQSALNTKQDIDDRTQLADVANSQLSLLSQRSQVQTATATPTIPGPLGASLSFLKSGKATHPDEQEVQDEYDLMLGALRSGENTGAAIRLAESHLAAHTNAIRPEMRDKHREPFPG